MGGEEEELKKKLPRLVVRVPRLAPHKVQAATAAAYINIKDDPEPPPMVTQRLLLVLFIDFVTFHGTSLSNLGDECQPTLVGIMP